MEETHLNTSSLTTQSKQARQLKRRGAKHTLSLAIYQGHWDIVKTLSSEKSLNWQAWVEVSADIEQTVLAIRHHLLQALGDAQSSGVRQAAAQVLAQFGHENPSMVDTLVNLLADNRSHDAWKIRQSAAQALGHLKESSPAVVAALVQALEDKQGNEAWRVRQSAARALGNLKASSPAVVDALVKALGDTPSSAVRQAAAQALGNLKALSPLVIETLLRALGDPEGYVRQSAAQALGHLNASSPAIVDALVKALGDTQSSAVRQAAAETLVQLSGENTSIVDTLINALGAHHSHQAWRVRQMAAQALGNVKQVNPSVVDALIRVLGDKRSHNAWKVRQSAAQALGNLKNASPPVVEALLQALNDTQSSAVRQAAEQALVQLGHENPSIVDTLRQVLGDKAKFVRQGVAEAVLESVHLVAVQTLEHPKEFSPAVVDALVQALGDTNAHVRQSAIQTLGQLSESMAHLWQSLPILKQGLLRAFGDPGEGCPELAGQTDHSVFTLIVRLVVRHGKKNYLLKHWRSCKPYLQCLDEAGNTGLHEAAKYQQRAIVELLLGRGIVDKRNQLGESAYDVALKGGAWEVAQALVGLKVVKVVDPQSVDTRHGTVDGKPQLLGSGAFGAVYKAHWNDTVVAYKQLHVRNEPLSPEFKSEVNLLSMNPHPNIVTIYAVTLSPLGLILEWMPKGSLRLVLDEQLSGKASPFSWVQKIIIAQDVVKGLTFLHDPSMNLLHRDLKAENVLLDDRYHAKLTDFGLAQVKKEFVSEKTQDVAGSLAWLAPEALSEPPEQTRASDMYSYGTVLWELTTRQEPYKGIAPKVIKAQILSGKRLELPLAETIPLAWHQLIQDCWRSTPKQRPTAATVTKYLMEHRNEMSAAEKDNEAVAHFKGLDGDKKDQLQSSVGYTAKTLRYLLPMLENNARCILYVADIDSDLVAIIEALALLSATLGRPAAFLLPSTNDKSRIIAGLLFKQRLVWIDPEGNDASLAQRDVLKTLLKKEILTHSYISSDAIGVSSDQYPDVNVAPASGVLLMEWLRGVLQRPLARLLQWSEKLPPSSGYCSLEGLQSASLQTLQAQTRVEGIYAYLSLLRQQHLVLLQVQPKEAIIRADDMVTAARTESEYLQQCWDSAAQRAVNQLIVWIEDKGSSTFTEKFKPLRNDDQNQPLTKTLKDAMNTLTKQLEEATLEKLPLISSSELVLLKRLGAGSFGEVHQGLWQRTPVAIKRLQGGSLPTKLQAEFEHESALLASLNHPNVVRLYGICKDDEDYPLCMVLEFAAGGALDRLNTHQLLWATRQRIALDIARGVDYLHQRQIVHGDLRACNILIDENTRAKVGDFGLAKQRVANMSMVMTNERTMGVSYWLSPELLRDGVRTKASDVYSFGMVLWEIMTGTQPFPREREELDMPVLLRIIEEEALWDNEHHSIPTDAPYWWVALMKACCHPDAAKRPTMSEVVECLFAQVEPQVYAAYSNKRGIVKPAKETVSAVEQRLRDIARLHQQFNSSIEQFTKQIKSSLAQENNLPIAMNDLSHLNTLLENFFTASLLPFKTSERSVQLFSRFFSVEGTYKEQGQRIARYLKPSDRKAMARVNWGFQRFFRQLLTCETPYIDAEMRYAPVETLYSSDDEKVQYSSNEEQLSM